MSYYVRKQYVNKSSLLDGISLESGKLYSNTVRFFWRTVRKKNLWLKPSSLMRIFNSDKIHAHSADASIQSFFSSLKSWKEKRKNDPSSKPPRRLRKYFPVTWKSSAIRIKNNNLILSNGKNQKPIIFDNWKYSLPVQTTLRWTGTKYEIIFVFNQQVPEFKETNKSVGIDIGQIHVAACSDGTILNGKLLRSIRQWKDKKISDYQNQMDTKKKRSSRWKKLKKAKHRFLKKVKNKSKDILHKYTTGLVATQKNNGVSTLVVGDLSGFRVDNNIGSKRNQENHSWQYSKIIWYLKYKAEKNGMKFVKQEESYTSQTCPCCGNKKKPTGRNYECSKCDFIGHRDIVGATNILRKYLGTFRFPVVEEMKPSVGIRYKPNIKVVQGFCLQSRKISSQEEILRQESTPL